ncbi:Uncharacterised protein [Bacteroides thetaiotaomicron]|uniref:Uncharacterized protein n=2 Tax=Bacteroides thetaiotaomicron TaxID=818 RepID=A0A174JBX3_BACT4|nr:Uncharacterised protein [Bacteroides thetaiotaomicron]
MIESGNKKEEYREIKKYWIGRLAKCGGRNSYEKTGFYCKKAICFSCITRGNGFHPKEYTHVCFRFGYTWKSHSTLTLLAKQNLPTLAII